MKKNKEAKKKQAIDYGFRPPKIEEAHYKLGGKLLGVVINEKGDWTKWLPVYEPQAENYETWGCTVWGGQNQIEILHKFLFGIEPNYDERFNYNLAEIGEGGTDPQITYDTFKNYGLIQGFLSIPDTYTEFCTPRPMEDKFIKEGKKWLNQYDLRHAWVTNPNEQTIKEALTYSPVAISVTAWIEKDGVYIDGGQPNTHWCVCFGYSDRGFLVFDSYDHSIKTVAYSHKISFAKVITLKKKDHITFWQKVKNALKYWLDEILK